MDINKELQSHEDNSQTIESHEDNSQTIESHEDNSQTIESHEDNSQTIESHEDNSQTIESHEDNSQTMSNGQHEATYMVSNGESEHVDSDPDVDVGSLLAIVDNIFKGSTHVVDSLVQGSQPSWERMEEERVAPYFNFVSPLCTLRKISYQLSCKAPGVETAKKTATTIMKKLGKYELEDKAVITLAALAMEYGDFWVLAESESNNLLAKSVGVLKRVNGLTMYDDSFEENSQAILELNALINTVLQLIHLIFDLGKLKASYVVDGNTTGVTALIKRAIMEIPGHVEWCIITIAAIASQIDSLITASHHHDLSDCSHNINIIFAKLKKDFKLINQHIAERNHIIELKKCLQTRTTILEVFKLLIFSSNTRQLLYHGATKRSVNIDVLREKNVLLFISTLEVTEEEISVMRIVHEGLKTNNHDEQYRLVWIPMVEEWTMTLQKKMEIAKANMPWYVVQVQHFKLGGGIAGYKFIKEDWHFNKNPMVVVMDHQGIIKHKDAFQFIKAWGMKAFPFDQEKQDEIDLQLNWLGPIIRDTYPTILPSIEEEKYTLFYGGTKQEWVQDFTTHATELADDEVLTSNNISIQLFCVESEEYKSVVTKFWSGIESQFMKIMTKQVHKTTMEMDEVTQEVRKMVSYKNESGWALLTKGSTVIVSGNSETVLRTVKEFKTTWKETVIKKGFQVSFKEYHAKIERETTHSCSMIAIDNVAGKLPQIIYCPYCTKGMDMISVSYKCCHNDTNATTMLY